MLVGITAVWGWTFVVVRDAIAIYGVLSFLTARFALATGAGLEMQPAAFAGTLPLFRQAPFASSSGLACGTS